MAQHDTRRRILYAGLFLASALGFWQSFQSHAQAQQTKQGPLSFEVASVKPNRSGGKSRVSFKDITRFVAENVTAKVLIQNAYNISEFQVSGGPGWIEDERFDINAKIEDSIIEKSKKLTYSRRQDLVRPMLQSLLAERFGLKITKRINERPIYALVVAKGGPRLSGASQEASKGIDPEPKIQKLPDSGESRITISGPASEFVDVLSNVPELGRRVIDKTGLKGEYEFSLQWAPLENQGPAGEPPHADAALTPEPSGPSIFTALQEQLGLKLEPDKGTIQYVIIEHIARPADN